MEVQSTTFRKLDKPGRRGRPSSSPTGGNAIGSLVWMFVLMNGLATILNRLAAARVSVFNLRSWGRIASLHPTLTLDYAIGRVIVGGVAVWLLYDRKTAIPNAVRSGLLVAFWFLAFQPGTYLDMRPGAYYTVVILLAEFFGGIGVLAALASPRRDADWFSWRKVAPAAEPTPPH